MRDELFFSVKGEKDGAQATVFGALEPFAIAWLLHCGRKRRIRSLQSEHEEFRTMGETNAREGQNARKAQLGEILSESQIYRDYREAFRKATGLPLTLRAYRKITFTFLLYLRAWT